MDPTRLLPSPRLRRGAFSYTALLPSIDNNVNLELIIVIIIPRLNNTLQRKRISEVWRIGREEPINNFFPCVFGKCCIESWEFGQRRKGKRQYVQLIGLCWKVVAESISCLCVRVCVCNMGVGCIALAHCVVSALL